MIKVSVVTVCYNEVVDIYTTLQSVAEQTYAEIEHIIQDGGSTDGTVDVIRQYASNHSNVIIDSAKDGGIYYGMNIGLSKCSGDYVIFCNGGDKFASHDVIASMVKRAEAANLPDLVYGDCASVKNGRLMVRPAHGPRFMKIGMPAAHEAMLYKLSLVRKFNFEYDVSYRIAADYKFTFRFLRVAQGVAYVDKPIVIFSDGGISTANRWQGLMESNRVRKEMGGIPMFSRLLIILMQLCALTLSSILGPIYRLFRLRRHINVEG